MESLQLVISSGLIATIITPIVTTVHDNKRAKRVYKMQVFRDIIAFRGDIVENAEIITGGFEQAINQVFIAFNDSKEVLNAFNAFRDAVNYASGDNTGKLITLIKSMADDLKISYNFANDDLFLSPLKVRKLK